MAMAGKIQIAAIFHFFTKPTSKLGLSMTNNPSNLDLPSTTPRILALPNEILLRIFSFLNYREANYLELSPILVLRLVCRHFRALTPDLDFWYEDDFSFLQIIPQSYRWDIYDRHHYLRALFMDANLANTLGRRKTKWKFEKIDILAAVVRGIPGFKQNARAIYLPHSVGRDDIIRSLAECSAVTSLSLQYYEETYPVTVNLSEIASSFPLLETLICSSSFGTFYGSLEPLNRLQTLRIDAFDSYMATRLWLPLQSRQTLTTLTLSFSEPIGRNRAGFFFDTPSLETFTNLKVLRIGRIDFALVEYLTNSPIDLETFEFEVLLDLAPVDLVLTLLHSPCLRNLKVFGVHLHDDFDFEDPFTDETERYWSLVFDAFTSILRSVEKIRMHDVPLHADFCTYLTRMKNLKEVYWKVFSGYLVFGCGDRALKEAMEEALESAFAGFTQKPHFAVEWSNID